MTPSRRGSVVVVTGANEGIGYHLTRALLNDGYRVAGFDVEGSNLRGLAEAHPRRARHYDCDVIDEAAVGAAVDAVVDEWGRIDVLVNNAAVFELGRFEERSTAGIREEFEVNLSGYLHTTRAVLPHMRARGEGIVHSVGSGVGQVGHPSLSGDAASKGAIEAFVRSIRPELNPPQRRLYADVPPATATRSATELDYPSFAIREPEYVGRRLADRIESTDRVVYADWVARVGMALVR